MKKLIFAGIMLVALLTACGEKTKESSKQEQKKTATIHLNKADFLAKVTNFETNPTEWKYLGDKPCIIDFYAIWCGPCKTLAPILEDLAKEYDGKITIYKVDTEDQQDLASVFGILSIPSLLFCPAVGAP